MKKKTKFPKRLYVYVCDFDDDGAPIYAVACTPDEIPEDQHGQHVATYILEGSGKLSVARSILSEKEDQS